MLINTPNNIIIFLELEISMKFDLSSDDLQSLTSFLSFYERWFPMYNRVVPDDHFVKQNL